MDNSDEDDIFASLNKFCKEDKEKLNEKYKKAALEIAEQNLLNCSSTDVSPSVSFENNLPTNSSVNNKRQPRGKKVKNDIDKKVDTVAESQETTLGNNEGESVEIATTSRAGRPLRRSQRNKASTSVTSSIPEVSVTQEGRSRSRTNSPETSAPKTRGKGRGRGRNRPKRVQNTIIDMLSLLQQQVSSQLEQQNSTSRYVINERASRAQVVDTVDLVSSPVILPSSSETICVDTDSNHSSNNGSDLRDISIGELDNDIAKTSLNVKVKWGTSIKSFQYRKYQKFTDIINYYAKRENTNKENICLNLGDRIIFEDDTPDSIDYKIHQFLHGRKVEHFLSEATTTRKIGKDPNSIEIQIQCDGKKRATRFTMSLKKKETFYSLFAKCSEEFKVPASKIRLSIDGESIKVNNTPSDFDLEGGEIIDCKICD